MQCFHPGFFIKQNGEALHHMKHEDIIQNMTTEEKAALLSGASEWTTREISRLGIPAIFFADGPHGIRKQAGAGDHLGLNPSLPATCFPTAATVANSWDEALGEAIGKALGEEAAAQGVHVLLGPGLNIKRSPLCGRNFEYFSEDPYLAGKMAAAYIRGIQSQGIYACPKHFAVNSQELRRMAMNAVLDERTLREIYLTGFEIAVKEGHAKAIMTSYNEVNGTYANENRHLMLDILRKEWGFAGIAITDWGGSNDHVQGVAARSNVEMPTPGLDSARQLLKALRDGTLSMQELDLCVDDLLDAILELHATGKTPPDGFDLEAHHALARKAAAESIVLLKNEGTPTPLLPLQEGCKVALIGDFAITPRYQGAGSSLVNPTRVETLEQVIRQTSLDCIGCTAGYRRAAGRDQELEREALELAERADVVLYCFGLDEISEVEGMDRIHMKIPAPQIELLKQLFAVNPHIVGILSAGSAVEMPWHTCCQALLHGYLCGQAGASAMLDILTGAVNPSGRLSESYPFQYEDTPAANYFPSQERNAEYREGLFVGYRYYDSQNISVQYPFGYGLSYTTFSYSNLHLDDHKAVCTVTNTGNRAGAEVVQLYVSGPRDAVFRPKQELKGFRKVYLEPGQSQAVEIPFDSRSFRYWNVRTNAWEQEAGIYTVRLGANSRDIRLEGTLSLSGTTSDTPYQPAQLPHYFSGNIQNVPDEEFEALLGHPIPSGNWSGELTANDAFCQMYYAKSGLARLICRIMTRKKEQRERAGKPDLNLLFIYNIPFRAIAKMTGGIVSMDMVDGIVDAVNGHAFRGLRRVLTGYFANRSANKAYEKKLAEGSAESEK